MNRLDNRIIKLIKIYVIGSLIAFGVAVGFWGYLAITDAFNSKRIIDAQVGVYKAQEENVGKPIIYEQYYHSPNK